MYMVHDSERRIQLGIAVQAAHTGIKIAGVREIVVKPASVPASHGRHISRVETKGDSSL